MSDAAAPRKESRKKIIITSIIGAVIMVGIFAVLFPHFADYKKALQQLAQMPNIWIAALIVSGLINIATYPFTALAAIPHIGYRAAFVERQSGFLVSNVIPGGGAIAVGTQYGILARYGVSTAAAAAAVSADAVWTYLLTLGFPSIAVVLLLIEGRSTTGFALAAGIGLVVVIVSLIVIIMTLRSEEGAIRIARLAQRPVSAVYRRFRRTAPDLSSVLLDFHKHASTMVATRWRELTITNLAAQLAPMLVLLCALAGLGAYPDQLSLVEIFAAYSVALLLTSFPITPGGLGTVDAALVGLLVAFGVDSSTAIAADLVWRIVWFLPQLLVGLGAMGIYWWDGKSMNIEVWSDVVCPWCYIGKRRLDEALAGFSGRDDVTVVHRAFQLDPRALSEGRRTVEVIAAKYGMDEAGAAAMMSNVSEVAASVGLAYHLDETVSGNTRDAHRLLLWAQEQGQSADLLEVLYSGYFEFGRDIFDIESLCDLTSEAGLDPVAARIMLAGTGFIDDVAADQALAAQFGATGVPFFVFDRAYGISGAQPLEAFVATLNKAAEGSSG